MRTLTASTLITVGCLLLAACNADRLTIPNYNSPTAGDIGEDPSALQLAANGIISNARGNFDSWTDETGRLGRESYSYFQTDGRSTTTWLIGPQDPTRGAGNAFWGGYYGQLRDIFNFKNTVSASTTLTEAQKSAALGFAKTFEAYALSFVVAAHGNFGAPVQVMEDPRQLSPWVSRDSIFNYVVGTLDEAKTDLEAGGTSFPFTLTSGFTGFDTPATFLTFNRALAARINARRASRGIAGCGTALSTTCYQTVLQNLQESFIDPSDLALGPVYVYSTQAGDSRNPMSNGSSPDFVAHPSIRADAELQADGTSLDQRYTDKIYTMDAPLTPGGDVPGIATDQDFTLFSEATDPLPVIRSEELVLLRSEAEWFTGAKAAAIADLNTVRETSGKLPPTTVTVGSSESDYLDALLYERRYSLLIEGDRWVDVRRFDRLKTLPLDVPEHALFDDLIIPQSECLIRNNTPPSCS